MNSSYTISKLKSNEFCKINVIKTKKNQMEVYMTKSRQAQDVDATARGKYFSISLVISMCCLRKNEKQSCIFVARHFIFLYTTNTRGMAPTHANQFWIWNNGDERKREIVFMDVRFESIWVRNGNSLEFELYSIYEQSCYSKRRKALGLRYRSGRSIRY